MTDITNPFEDLFLRALEVPESERDAFLAGECGDDTERLDQVRELLSANDQTGSFVVDRQAEWETRRASDSAGVQVGNSIGPYKLLQEIGEGGMGVVFMADQKEPIRRRVALKVIKPGMDSKQVLARFEAERQALAMMEHPNIAKVYEAGKTESGLPYFVMELVKGVPITKFCDDNQMTAKGRLGLFVDVCMAVQHAHQKGIIHRDLKPSNVLVAKFDDQPVVKVIDFGVAKATNQELTERTMFTQFGQIVGTLEYMSPEQAQFNQLDIDTRSDIYSLGILLYELLTGSPPFDRQRLRSAAFDEIMRIIREEEPPRPSLRLSTLGKDAITISKSRNTDVSALGRLIRGDVDLIVMKALEKDRTKRHETAAGFAAEIQRYLNDEPISSRPPSSWDQITRFYRRNRALVSSSMLIAAGLLFGSSLAFWQYLVATDKAEQLQLANDALTQQTRTAQERLAIVKDYTMILARGGSERDLNLALQTAELVGASELWKAMLAAQHSLENNQSSVAIDVLERAFSKTSPGDELAAKGLLANAYLLSGRTDEHLPLARELQKAEPTTSAEFILVGAALRLDAAKWWEYANQAIDIQDSPFARFNRAQAAIDMAMDGGELSIALQGLDDLGSTHGAVTKTPLFISTRVALLTTVLLLSDEEHPEKPQWREQADADVATLRFLYPEYSWGILLSAWYLDTFEPEQADEMWEAVLERGPGGWADIHAAAMILRTGELKEWEHAFEGSEILERTAWACLICILEPERTDEAMAVYRDIVSKLTVASARSGWVFEIAILAKDFAAVKRDAKRLLETAEMATDFDRLLLKLFAGKIRVAEVEQAVAQMDRTDQLMANAILGYWAYAHEDLQKARTYFMRTRETCIFHTSDFYWARAMLKIVDEELASETTTRNGN